MYGFCVFEGRTLCKSLNKKECKIALSSICRPYVRRELKTFRPQTKRRPPQSNNNKNHQQQQNLVCLIVPQFCLFCSYQPLAYMHAHVQQAVWSTRRVRIVLVEGQQRIRTTFWNLNFICPAYFLGVSSHLVKRQKSVHPEKVHCCC